MRKYMNKSEFARHCEVTPPCVARGIKDKRILTSSNGFIDANHAKNIEFMHYQAERRTRLKQGRTEAELYSERIGGRVMDDEPIGDELLEDPDDDLPPPPPKKPLTPDQLALLQADRDSMSEIDYAIEKMRSTTAINKARLAEMVRATVRRDFVDRVIAMIGTAISDHLITLGDRLSPDLAAIAGSTEASVIRRIKQTLDDDISAALHEMQRVVVERYERRLEL
jgi:hypothetical protein